MSQRRPLHPTAILVLLFAAAIAVGTALLWLPVSARAPTSLLQALFTATSAVCVTGLAVVDTGTHWTGFGQAVILLLIQLGGFGMMTAASLLAMLVSAPLRSRSRLLLQTETRALSLGDVRSVAKLVLVVTLSVELVATGLLAARFALGYGMSWGEALWQGLFHAVSAFNNAGFSTWSDSLTRFVADPGVLLPVMAAIVIGGLGFPVLHELLLRRRQRVRLSLHARLTLQASAVLLVFGFVSLLASEWHNPRTLGALDLPGKLWAAAFASVAARTAGFNTVDIGALNSESLMLHNLLMFIGGGSAGTAGGVKLTTVGVLLLVLWNEVRGHADVEYAGRRIAGSAQRLALTVFLMGGAVVVIGTLVLVPLAPAHRFEALLFEVVSAFATVGLSTGLTPQLPPAGQLLLVLLMFIGRVGIVTLAVAVALNAGRRPYRYPEEKPLVG